MSRSELSHYETGMRFPSLEKAARLEQALMLRTGHLGATVRPQRARGASAWRRSKLWKRFCPHPGRYRVERDRDNWVRMRAAQRLNPVLYYQCLQTALQRHGRRALSEFLHYASCDSGPEMLSWLLLLAGTAQIAYVPIARLGWDRLAIIQPSNGAVVGHLPWPALVFEHPVPMALFPQVSLQRVGYRLDFLVCIRRKEGCSWAILEIDGAAHDPTTDPSRTQTLALPTLRIKTDELYQESFESRLLERLVGSSS